MSYIDYVEKAARRYFDLFEKAKEKSNREPTIAEAQNQIEGIWDWLERRAKEENYEVLECTMDLRTICAAMASWLYVIPGATAEGDANMLRIKDAEYGGSWQKRGGPGAFFAACRKWDRYEQSVAKHGSLENALAADKREEGILDDVGDLRRYLVLWEAWRLEHDAYRDSLPRP
jgi:hypothetical protein